MGKLSEKQERSARRLGERFAVPTQAAATGKIPSRKPFHSVESSFKAALMIGRTDPFLRSSAPPAEVDELARRYRVFDMGWLTPVVWDSLSVSYRIDIIATKILQGDREERGEQERRDVPRPKKGVHRDYRTDGMLSPRQAWHRRVHELPMELGGMEAMVIHYAHVKKVF